MAELSTLGGVIKTAYEGEADTNALTDTLLGKLNGIEASADVTDTANVTAAGALMDSEVTNLAAVKAFDPTDYATAAQGSTADTALQNVVEDTTPQLGGNLDVQASSITTSTVNGGITLTPNGTGDVTLGTMVFDADQTIGAGQDNYVLTYDNAAGKIALEAAAAGSGDFKADGTVDMTGEFKTDVGTFGSDVADGASAVAFRFGNTAAYSTSGAKLLVLDNAGTDVFGLSYQGGISHLNSGATTAAHAQSFNLNWTSSAAKTSSGQYSFVLGTGNTASDQYTVAVGQDNTASDVGASAFGRNNSSTYNYAFSAGYGNTNAGNRATVFGLSNNVEGPAAGENSLTIGANANTIHTGAIVQGGGGATDGEAQVETVPLRIATTDATQTTMLADGDSVIIPSDTSWAFSALVIARSDEADGNDSAAYRLEGLLARDEANNTALVGSITKTVIAESAGATAWDVTAEADDTNEALAIKVTGEAATNIRWVAKVDIAQVTYA